VGRCIRLGYFSVEGEDQIIFTSTSTWPVAGSSLTTPSYPFSDILLYRLLRHFEGVAHSKGIELSIPKVDAFCQATWLGYKAILCDLNLT
jgi:hypothetical protein